VKNPLLIAADRMRHVYWFVVRPLRVGVLALVVDDAGRVLLVEHTYRHGWTLPGGSAHRKEALEDALRRELREEVGVEPTAAPQLHGVYSNFAQWKSDHIVVFVVERWQQRPARSLEIENSRFFGPEELPEDTSESARRRIAEYTAGTPGVVGPW
jgi:ADP-ribose pyrophosphatase YjhB (NUDIX family)